MQQRRRLEIACEQDMADDPDLQNMGVEYPNEALSNGEEGLELTEVFPKVAIERNPDVETIIARDDRPHQGGFVGGMSIAEAEREV